MKTKNMNFELVASVFIIDLYTKGKVKLYFNHFSHHKKTSDPPNNNQHKYNPQTNGVLFFNIDIEKYLLLCDWLFVCKYFQTVEVLQFV